jgi:hypothetical protein
MRRKKDTFWHSTALFGIEHGFKPAQIVQIVKSIFPHTNITGRNIGAYRRRLLHENTISKLDRQNKPNIPIKEMVRIISDSISLEDKFVHRCNINNRTQIMKKLENKLNQEAEISDKLDIWIRQL